MPYILVSHNMRCLFTFTYDTNVVWRNINSHSSHIHIAFVYLFLYSHRTLCFQDTVFGYKKGLKIEFNNIFLVRWFLYVFETVTLIMELVNWSRKEPTNEVRFCSILYFIHKIVRKIGQNRDFVKFHQALRNWALNI